MRAVFSPAAERRHLEPAFQSDIWPRVLGAGESSISRTTGTARALDARWVEADALKSGLVRAAARLRRRPPLTGCVAGEAGAEHGTGHLRSGHPWASHPRASHPRASHP